jgi:capsule assembly protein Wzi
VLSAFFIASISAASPWAGPGDERLRHAIQSLVDQGCLSALTGTWPLAWRDAPEQSLSASCQTSSAYRYLRHERKHAQSSGFSGEVGLSGATEEPLFRGFADQPRERGEVSVGVGAVGPTFVWSLQAQLVDAERDDHSARLDGSFIAAKAYGWVWGAGAIERWWGPGWYSSTMLSSNARPVPSVWVTREQSTASTLPLVRYLGPWNLTLFAGQLESDRVIPHARLLGARFSFRPWTHLEIGLSRLVQWGGEGRPEGLDSLWDVIIGRDNGATSGFDEGEDPGNQIGGVDFRLGVPLRASTLGVYGQLTGDDEAGGMPSKYSGLAGIDWATNFAGYSQRWIVEGTNTIAGGWFGEDRLLTAYEHSTYGTGLRYHGRNIASTWERDAEVVTVGAMQFFNNGHEVSLNYSNADLNQAGTLRPASLSPTPPLLALPEKTRVSVFSARWRFPVKRHRFTLSAQHFSEPLVTVSGELESSNVMAAWDYRFEY